MTIKTLGMNHTTTCYKRLVAGFDPCFIKLYACATFSFKVMAEQNVYREGGALLFIYSYM